MPFGIFLFILGFAILNTMNDHLKKQFQPYLFALKEGKEIQKDFMDYSLMLIQVHNSEVMRSPVYYQKINLENPRQIST